jgi:pimeloyl-ACP methyl ester carboxylesterase
VDVGGGRRIYLECHGSGSPTVILQSGYGNAGDIWSVSDTNPPPVAQGIAGFTRECTYDRPGSVRLSTDTGAPAPEPLPSRSDPAPMPRTAADVVTELHTVLAATGVPGPYLLVGHSLGGLFDLLYARTYPDQVAGLVGVDGVVPGEQHLLTPQQWAALGNDVRSPSPIPDYTMEAYDLTASADQVDAAPPLPTIPLVLLLAEHLGTPPANQEQLYTAIENARRTASTQLADSLPGGRAIVIPGTTHYLHYDRPDAVIATVRSMTR